MKGYLKGMMYLVLSVFLLTCISFPTLSWSKQPQEKSVDTKGDIGENEDKGSSPKIKSPEKKRVVMIIAHKGYRDEELNVPKNILEKSNIIVKLASTSLKNARGMLGDEAKVDLLIDEVDVDDYAAVIFVGGTGASVYWSNARAHYLAKQAIKKGKVIGAICIAPVTLARAGVLTGKKATVWSSEASELEVGGATYTGREVERDGNIVTANGPRAAEGFANAILELLSEK